MVKAGYAMIKAAVTHWRTTLGISRHRCVAVVVGLAVPRRGAGRSSRSALVVWRWRHRVSFETWAGRRLRSWWQRWAVYARRLPGWLRACGLTVLDADRPIVLTANPLGRNKVRRQPKQRVDQVPRVLGVRSGASWDEVRVRLVPGQKPEDFDEKARELAVARGVARCQVRELSPNVVSIDFQRRNLLADTVWCRELADLVDVAGSDVDLDEGLEWTHRLRHRLAPIARRFAHVARWCDRCG